VMEWVPALAKIGLVLLALWWVRRALLRMIPTRERVEEAVKEVPVPSAAELRRREIATEVERFTEQRPEEAAALLRAWMTQSEE